MYRQVFNYLDIYTVKQVNISINMKVYNVYIFNLYIYTYKFRNKLFIEIRREWI